MFKSFFVLHSSHLLCICGKTSWRYKFPTLQLIREMQFKCVDAKKCFELKISCQQKINHLHILVFFSCVRVTWTEMKRTKMEIHWKDTQWPKYTTRWWKKWTEKGWPVGIFKFFHFQQRILSLDLHFQNREIKNSGTFSGLETFKSNTETDSIVCVTTQTCDLRVDNFLYFVFHFPRRCALIYACWVWIYVFHRQYHSFIHSHAALNEAVNEMMKKKAFSFLQSRSLFVHVPICLSSSFTTMTKSSIGKSEGENLCCR